MTKFLSDLFDLHFEGVGAFVDQFHHLVSVCQHWIVMKNLADIWSESIDADNLMLSMKLVNTSQATFPTMSTLFFETYHNNWEIIMLLPTTA